MKMDDLRNAEEESGNDDEHIYANVQEMEEESRRQEQPPTPDPTQQPIREVGGGWSEHITEAGRFEVSNYYLKQFPTISHF